MVNKEVVIKTIKKMLNSGIEDKIILSTLSDLGLTEQESEELLLTAKGTSGVKPKETGKNIAEIPEKEAVINEKVSETETPSIQEYDIDSVITQTSNKIKEHLAEKEGVDVLKQQSTDLKLEEQDDKLNELHKKIDSVHGKIDAGSLNELKKEINAIEKDVSEIKNDFKDFKAKINAMHDIMKKILETERKLLTKK